MDPSTTHPDVGAFLKDFYDHGKRTPVIRTGPREPISPIVRRLVYRRDQWTCQHCGSTPFAATRNRRSGALNLDHITPWSAGGTDRSDNLRTLCTPCNQDRSNFVTGREQASLPIVRICALCLTGSGVQPETAFDAYCACHHHVSWVLPGWQIL